MSLASLLNTTCTIQRNTQGAQDAHGHPAASWADTFTSVPCRLSGARGREINVDQMVVVADYVLYVGPATDITERDRVVLGGVTYDVKFVATVNNRIGAHHKEAALQVIR